MALTKETILAKNEEKFIVSDLGDELVMMDLETGNYIGLNEVARDIWEHVTGESTVTTLIANLVTAYDISAEACESDVMEHLEEMLKKEMVVIK